MENKKTNDNYITDSKLEIHVEHLDTFSLVAPQNDFLLFKNTRLKLGGDAVDFGNKVQPLKNLPKALLQFAFILIRNVGKDKHLGASR